MLDKLSALVKSIPKDKLGQLLDESFSAFNGGVARRNTARAASAGFAQHSADSAAGECRPSGAKRVQLQPFWCLAFGCGAALRPRTGRCVAPDGQMYRQSDLVRSKAAKTWKDMLISSA